MHGYFTTSESAKILGVKESTVLRWIRDDVFTDVQIDEGGFSGRPSFCINQSEVERLASYIFENQVRHLMKHDVRRFKAQPLIDELMIIGPRYNELVTKLKEILEIES